MSENSRARYKGLQVSISIARGGHLSFLNSFQDFFGMQRVDRENVKRDLHW